MSAQHFKICGLLKYAVNARILITTITATTSGLDKSWKLWMMFLKPALRQHTSESELPEEACCIA